MDQDSFREAFLCANANREFIVGEFADVVRSLVRAFASTESSRAISDAATRMEFVAELLKRCDDHITWYNMFSGAISEIHGCMPDDRIGGGYVHAGRAGTKYLIESSATDGAARGRASRRLQEFQTAARWALERRGSG